jgi:CGNR zinc finger/Putative stress-induced transcription regulator
LLFAPDTNLTLEFTTDFLNSAPAASKSGVDEIATPPELTALLDKHTYSGRFDRDEAERLEVVQTRDRLRRIWTLPPDRMALEINTMLREANAVTQLARHDAQDWHLHATPRDAPLAERIRVEVSLALADVVRSGETSRMRVCSATNCDGVLVDFSRNGSKHFCSVRCGNRMNMVAYRERQSL